MITPQERVDDCLAMLQGGATLEECGQKWGITRERVRQILLKEAGVVAGEIRTARMTRLRAMMGPRLCPYCKKPYQTNDGHFSRGNHRFSARQENRTPAHIAEDANIAADYDAGLTYDAIVAKYDVDNPRITRALRWNGLEPDRRIAQRKLRTRRQQYARWDAIVTDWQTETLLNEEIAAKHEVSSALVGLILRKRGLNLTRGDAQRRIARIRRYQRRQAQKIARE